MSDIYAAAYPIYRDRGWSPIKLHAGTKWPPPVGFTGYGGAHPSGADMWTWAEEEPDGNLAVRLGETVVGIDVDAHSGKTGGKTLAEAERRWGPLPPTPRSSSRADDPVSGIRFFRIPAGTKLVTLLGFPELGLGGVEIIQQHHRYGLCCWRRATRSTPTATATGHEHHPVPLPAGGSPGEPVVLPPVQPMRPPRPPRRRWGGLRVGVRVCPR